MTRDQLEGVGDMQEPPIDPERTQDRPQALRCSHSCHRTASGQTKGLSAITTRTDGAALGIAMTGVDVRSRKTQEG
jgi:hypothetical protein